MERALAAVNELRDPDPNIVSLVRDHVWWRRVAYFALLGSALLAFSLPWTAPYVSSLANAVAEDNCRLLRRRHPMVQCWPMA